MNKQIINFLIASSVNGVHSMNEWMDELMYSLKHGENERQYRL